MNEINGKVNGSSKRKGDHEPVKNLNKSTNSLDENELDCNESEDNENEDCNNSEMDDKKLNENEDAYSDHQDTIENVTTKNPKYQMNEMNDEDEPEDEDDEYPNQNNSSYAFNDEDEFENVMSK